jgi:hypothetical protein
LNSIPRRIISTGLLSNGTMLRVSDSAMVRELCALDKVLAILQGTVNPTLMPTVTPNSF